MPASTALCVPPGVTGSDEVVLVVGLVALGIPASPTPVPARLPVP